MLHPPHHPPHPHPPHHPHHVTNIRERARALRKALKARRRGGASLLSMMFLIMFGSLAAAMAIVSQGNIRTAAVHLHVQRAMGAAETGLAVAAARLEGAASRFVVEQSDIDSGFGQRLWTGTFSGDDGQVGVLDPPDGNAEGSTPGGLAEALANVHAADENTMVVNGIDAPTIGDAPAGTDSADYATGDWVYTPAVRLNSDADDPNPAAFQVTYAPLANGTDVRAIVTGYDFAHTRGGVPLSRTITRDFRVVKRVDSAIVASSRVMIGKNVNVTGDIGATYDDVAQENGHPLVLRSDFAGLAASLDAKLVDLNASIDAADVDGDGRLRVGHPIEGQALGDGGQLNGNDYDGDGQGDGAFDDATGDGYVDEFDAFINQYDTNGDGKVTLSSSLTAGTPAQGQTPEFEADDNLALLIDSNNPDRNRNGLYGYVDEDHDGNWDPEFESLVDYDQVHETYPDQVLGYRDGFIDRKDYYAKVQGRLIFRVQEDAWAEAQETMSDQLRGPIRPENGESARQFGTDEGALPDLSADSFSGNQSDLQEASDGESFAHQVAYQLGISDEELATYEETGSDPDTPKYLRLDPDTNGDGLPENAATAYFEKMPFNSPNYADWYYRPVYENMTFRDVQVPMGTNALFRNCTFVGVTYIRCQPDNTNKGWTLYGKMQLDPNTGRPAPDPARTGYGDEPGEDASNAPPSLPETAIPPNQIVSLADPPLDKGDVLASEVALIANYDELPEPLLFDGLRVTDSKVYSNNIRFHDCLIVGSLISDTPMEFTNVRNKLQFTGATRFVEEHPDFPDDPEYNPEAGDADAIAKSSLMVPNYSVDIGNFNSPPEQDVQLKGAVIAGVMDVRGNASINGALLLTFKPVLGEGPLSDYLGNPVGNPADFNTTIGYFGPDDGDQESVDPNDLPIVDGQKVVGWDLDGDGLIDLNYDNPPTDEQIANGATAIPFYGYGRIQIRFNPDMILPDGIMLPLQMDVRASSYREGSPWN